MDRDNKPNQVEKGYDLPITPYSIWSITSGYLAHFAKSSSYQRDHHNAGTHRVPVTYNLISGGGRVILFDVGWQDPRIVKTYEVADWEPIVTQLERLGVKPEDVDSIVLSHVHFDHAGQLGHFPKAAVYLQKAEMDFIKFVQNYPDGVTKARLRGSFLRVDADTLAAIDKDGRLRLVDGFGDLGPGLQIVPALNTHSAGSQMLVVNTVAGPMVLTGDAVYERGNIVHANPMGTNLGSNLECIVNFERILALARGNIEMVIPAHDPAIFSYWPSWQMGESYVTEIALAPGQQSLKPV